MNSLFIPPEVAGGSCRGANTDYRTISIPIQNPFATAKGRPFRIDSAGFPIGCSDNAIDAPLTSAAVHGLSKDGNGGDAGKPSLSGADVPMQIESFRF